MTDYQLLKKILHGAEVTIEKNNAWLDRYKSSYAEVDWDFCMMLFQTKLIDIDTGNFETGETHYFLDDKFIRFDKKNVKHVSIKKIDTQIKDVRNNLTYYNKFSTFVRLLEAFDKIKNNTIRKQKLEKINESR
jgi:hypothetical protein